MLRVELVFESSKGGRDQMQGCLRFLFVCLIIPLTVVERVMDLVKGY